MVNGPGNGSPTAAVLFSREKEVAADMFDAVLDRSNVPRSRFGTGTTLSVILHAGLLALALWLSMRPPAKKEKEVAVKFMLPPPPPPPPPPKSSTKPKVERVERKPIRR